MPVVYDGFLDSELNLVKPAIVKCLGFIRNKIPQLSQSDSFDLKVILNEVLINAIKHGNGCDSRKRVCLKVEFDAGYIRISVTDEGGGFNHRALIERLNDVDNLLDEGGRGIKIVNGLTDCIEFNESGNEIRLSKRIG